MWIWCVTMMLYRRLLADFIPQQSLCLPSWFCLFWNAKCLNLGPHVKARTQNHTYKGFPLFKFNLQYACLSYRECFWNTKQVPSSLSKDCTALKWLRSTPALPLWWYSRRKTSTEDRECANNADSVPHKREDRCGLWIISFEKQQEEHVLRYAASTNSKPGWKKWGEWGLREAGWRQEAIRLRKESRPDVISNGDLLKGLGPETKIEGHYKTLLQDRHSTLNDGLTHQFLMGTLWNGEVWLSSGLS